MKERLKDLSSRVLSRIVELLFHADVDYGEFQNCVFSVILGLWIVIYPSDSPENGIRAVDVVRSILPHRTVGLLMMNTGFMHSFFLIDKNYKGRRFMSFVEVCMWTGISFFLFRTGPGLLMTPTSGLFAVAAAIGFWRLRTAAEKIK